MQSCYDINIRRESDLKRVGKVDRFSNLSASVKFNDIGDWSLTARTCDESSKYLIMGNGIEIIRNGKTIITGPIRRVEVRNDGEITVSGFDDLIYLKDRLCLLPPWYPTTTPTAKVDTYPASPSVSNSEDIIKRFVSLNAGPTVPSQASWRKIPNLVIETNQNRGATGRRESVRFENLFDFCKRVATNALGFRIVRKTDINGILILEFQCYQWGNKRTHVLSRERGNLGPYTYVQDFPTANYAYVSGDTDTSTTFRSVAFKSDDTSRAKYGTVETYGNFNVTNDQAQLTQELDRILADGSEIVNVAAETIETDSSKLGTHYWVGDIVTLILNGKQTDQYVYEADFSYDWQTQKEEVHAKVGTLGNRKTPVGNKGVISGLFSWYNDLSNRLKVIERKD